MVLLARRGTGPPWCTARSGMMEMVPDTRYAFAWEKSGGRRLGRRELFAHLAALIFAWFLSSVRAMATGLPTIVYLEVDAFCRGRAGA